MCMCVKEKEMGIGGSLTPTPSSEAMLLFVVLVAMEMLSPSGACPESCYCFDDSFVTCSNFNMLDLAMLPHGTDTLTLSSGDVDELPMGFLAMAKRLKLLEINKLRVSVVRQGAFRGLANLEKVSITDSIFDIVEPESFSGMNSIQEFEIISSQFGRVGKHAFSSVRNIRKFTLWLSSFGTLADEVFFKMQDVKLFQLYTSNISHVGRDIFRGARGVEEATIYSNSIHSLAESSLAGLFESSKKVSVYRNVFTCSCDLSWVLAKSELLDNVCVVPGQSFSVQERSFQLRDMTTEALCAVAQETQTVAEEPHNGLIDDHVEEDLFENRPPEISQHSDEVGLASTGNSSQPQIFPVIEAFDEDLTIIDQVLFQNILPPTSGEPNETQPHLNVNNERTPERVDGFVGTASKVHERITLLGSLLSAENSSQIVQVTEIIPEVFIPEIGEKIITDDLFETGDTSTEDERLEPFNIVGDYMEVTTAPARVEADTTSPSWRDPLEPPLPSSEEPTTDGTIVSWEQESVYFDQKTPLSSSENDGFESETSIGGSSFIEGPDDEDGDVDDENGDGADNESSSSATKIVIDKLALAISGRVGESQGRQNVHDDEADERDRQPPANLSVPFRSSLLCALASCLFCILHWLVLV
ncbi:hypothetical protein Btru_032230 [Bulinus truncatus]|nr:hypothetical protein Btru_032230 [Bulinus truncatus]